MRLSDLLTLIDRLPPSPPKRTPIRLNYFGFLSWVYNGIITHVPIYCLRRLYLTKVFGYSISKTAFIHLGCYISCSKLEIGEDSVIGTGCKLIGDISIGKHVGITADTIIQSVSHDKNSPTFSTICKPISIDDYCFVGMRSFIFLGAKLGKGCVVGACSFLNKTVGNYEIFAGVPAKKIGNRLPEACEYELNYHPMWN